MSTRTTSKRRGRGPLVVMNPADQDYSKPSPPLSGSIDPSSSAQTPSSSDQSSYYSPYTDRLPEPLRTNIADQMHPYGTNRSPSSPSGSSSPPIESSPPPSTPSQSAALLGFIPDEGSSVSENASTISPEDRTGGTVSTNVNRVTYFSKFRPIFSPHPLHQRRPSNHRPVSVLYLF